MIAAARILRLNVEPAIRIVDGCVSISGTTHSVPITLTHSSKLTGTLGVPVSHFESPTPLQPVSSSLFTSGMYASELPQAPLLASSCSCAKLSNWSLLQELTVTLSCPKNCSEPTAFAAFLAPRRSTTPLCSPPAVLSPPFCSANTLPHTFLSAWTPANPALTLLPSSLPGSNTPAHPLPSRALSPLLGSPVSSARTIFKLALLFPPRTILTTTMA